MGDCPGDSEAFPCPFKDVVRWAQRSKLEDQTRHADAQRGMDRKQCIEIEESLTKNNSRRAYQLVKKFTQRKQARVSNIQDKEGNGLPDEKAIVGRWTEYCSELYNNQA